MKANVFVTLGIVCLSTILFSACVYSPYDGDAVTSATPIDFEGFALGEGSTMTIEAYNKQTGNWDSLATTTASSGAVTYGGDDLYPWSYSLDLSTLPNFICYWDASCSWPGAGTYVAQFRVHEGSSHYVASFQDGGITCVMNDVVGGSSWLTAGYNCMSPNSPIVNLYMYIVF